MMKKSLRPIIFEKDFYLANLKIEPKIIEEDCRICNKKNVLKYGKHYIKCSYCSKGKFTYVDSYIYHIDILQFTSPKEVHVKYKYKDTVSYSLNIPNDIGEPIKAFNSNAISNFVFDCQKELIQITKYTMKNIINPKLNIKNNKTLTYLDYQYQSKYSFYEDLVRNISRWLPINIAIIELKDGLEKDIHIKSINRKITHFSPNGGTPVEILTKDYYDSVRDTIFKKVCKITPDC